MRSARSRCAPRCPCYCPARPSPRTHCSAATTSRRLRACHDRPARLRPITATCFAVPQFLPQIRRLATTGDTAGVSWSWATLTGVNNAAWIPYFILARYPTALISSSSVTLLAGALAVLLTRRRQARARPAALIGTWAVLLAAAGDLAGRTGL